MDDLENELKTGFLDEADQMLADVEKCFLSLEANRDDANLLDQIFRLAHILKGTPRAVGFNELADFTHEFESFLLKVKSKEIAATSAVVDVLLKCNDHIKHTVQALRRNLAAKVDNTEALALLAQVSAPDVSDEMAGFVKQTLAPQAAPATVPTPAPHSTSAAPTAPAAQSDESIRVSLGRLEKLMNNVGELVILQTVLAQQKHSIQSTLLQKTIGQLEKITKEIQDVSMSLRMVPLKQTFQKMQRIVRDTSGKLGKEVVFEIAGEDSELDKTVLDHLGDPLVHLVRNAIDHGLESTDDRVKAGKPAAGRIKLSAYHQGGHIIIEASDDGRGLDPQKLRAKAIEKGIITASQTLSDSESYNLIFHPGFSTKSEVTDISGRGVGLDVVKTNVEKLQGEIQLETVLGRGTTFRILLPLTLAIIDGMVVQVADERFVVPITQVHESLQPLKEDVHHVTGVGEVLNLRGESIKMFRLSALLGRPKNEKPSWECISIVVRNNAKAYSVVVDDIIGQQQVVIKRLGSEISAIKGLSGSAILGDGKAALILDCNELILRKGAA